VSTHLFSKFDATFKAKVALEALREDMTVEASCTKRRCAPTRIRIHELSRKRPTPRGRWPGSVPIPDLTRSARHQPESQADGKTKARRSAKQKPTDSSTQTVTEPAIRSQRHHFFLN
jgi:hypothetical protein